MKYGLKCGVFALAMSSSIAAADTLQVAVAQSPAGLDPHVATAFSSALIYQNIYEGLVALDADLSVQPALAESWTIADDGRTYVFKLRQGVTFHNGDAFDSEDVVGSFDRVRDKETGSPIASRFSLIEDVTAAGSHEVTIRLSAPFAPMLSQLAGLYIVPGGGAAGDLQREPVGTGPFKLTEWVPDTYLHLDAHDGYWESGLPKLQSVRFSIVPEASTRQIGLVTGTYHLLPNVDSATALTLAADPNAVVLETADMAYSLIGVNVTQPPFGNPKVREAFNYGINRQEIIEAALFGKGEPAGPLPQVLAQSLPTSQYPCYQHDSEKAKALLAESGADSAITIKVLGTVQQVVDIAQVVQAQLNQSGFQVDLDIQELGQFVQDWKNSNFTAFASLNRGNPDPDGYMYRAFYTGGYTNVFGYSNTQIDGWLDEARTETDAGKRKSIYGDIQRVLACEGPIVHIAFAGLFTVVRPEVQGFQQSPDRSLRSLRQTSLAN